MADTTPVPIGADAALALLVAAVEAETDPSWECNSYHPALWSALDVARAALATAAQPPAADLAGDGASTKDEIQSKIRRVGKESSRRTTPTANREQFIEEGNHTAIFII